MPSSSSLVRWGLWTLPVSGVIYVAGYLVNRGLPNPAAGAVACMTAFGAPEFACGSLINLAGLLLNPFGFVALYAYLVGAGPSRAAVGGLILNVLGLAMSLVGYGVIVFDLTLLGQLYTQGKAPAVVGFAVATNPVFVGFMLLAGLVYVIGSLLFSVALWRGQASPKWVAVAFTLSAVFLCFGPFMPVPAPWADLLGAVLLVASGGWIAQVGSGGTMQRKSTADFADQRGSIGGR